MQISTVSVANNFLQHSFKEKKYITPMVLQKLLALAAEAYEGECGEPLFYEIAQSWAYGPVFYSVYNKFRHYGDNIIDRYGNDAMGNHYIVSDVTITKIIDEVWDTYKDCSKDQLIHIVRRPYGPWDNAYQNGDLTVSFAKQVVIQQVGEEGAG